MEQKQLTLPSQILELSDSEMEELWQWAYRTQSKRPTIGLGGMPLLSIGRLIEFLIDYKIPLNKVMYGLELDFQNNPDAQILDILWGCVKVILKSPKREINKERYIPTKPGGTMKQWVSRDMWKQLSDFEQSRLRKWATKDSNLKLFNAPSTDFFNTTSLYDVPMLSVGYILELLSDHGMPFSAIFKGLAFYENKEWNKKQLIDVLWENVKIVLKANLQNNIANDIQIV